MHIISKPFPQNRSKLIYKPFLDFLIFVRVSLVLRAGQAELKIFDRLIATSYPYPRSGALTIKTVSVSMTRGLGGYPIEIESQRSKFITYSKALFIL